MKKSNSIVFSLIKLIGTILLLYSLLFIISTNFIENRYYEYKYTLVLTYIDQNPDLVLRDLLLYSDEQGFAVESNIQPIIHREQEATNTETIDVILPFKEESALETKISDLNVSIQRKHIYIGTEYKQYSLYINPNLLNDISNILNSISIVTSLFFFGIILVIYIYLHMKVVNPLGQVSDYIRDLKEMKEDVVIPELKEENEIKEILDRLLELEESINIEIINRNEMLRAISHEFRTPLSHISTILWLYENKSDKYADFDYTKSEINKVIEDNRKLIDRTLSSLKVKHSLKRIDMDICEVLKECLESFEIGLSYKEVEIDLKELKINANSLAINLILNNILSNVTKYSTTCIKIYQENKKIIFENDFLGDNNNDGVGKTIIKTLCDTEKVKLVNKIEDKKYITILDFENK